MAGYGLGTRIRATLARILIPGPATDPHLRIRSPGACLRSTDDWTFGTDFAFLTDSFDLNFYLEKVCSRRLLRGGNCVFAVKSGLKQGIVGTAFFKLLSSFYMSRGGGSEAPIRRLARWGLLLKLHRTSLEEKSNFNTRVYFLRLLLRGLYGPSHILTVLETGLKIQQFK